MTMSIDGPGKGKKTATTRLQRVALLDRIEHFLFSRSQDYNVLHIKVETSKIRK